ncbi:MAG: hypothetical protein JO304_02660 [Solirubrobacterales bacterium]|nr:hypothetical protein [Solirubrobacterales bacterium]
MKQNRLLVATGRYQIDQSRLFAAQGPQVVRDLLQRPEYPLQRDGRRAPEPLLIMPGWSDPSGVRWFS